VVAHGGLMTTVGRAEGVGGWQRHYRRAHGVHVTAEAGTLRCLYMRHRASRRGAGTLAVCCMCWAR